MISFKLLFVCVMLLPSLWAESGVAALEKRFSINMMDPLTRRSALDKNFVRFGRSGGGLNVNREGRGRPDSFVRFGRRDVEDRYEDQDDGISQREPRGKTDFIRFGRGSGGSNSGFIRFGRGRNDNFVRFGRARQDNFIRFGKSGDNEGYDFQRPTRNGGPNRQNTNFVRFGKRVPENDEEIVNAYKNGLNLDLDDLSKENLIRMARYSNRNKGDSFIRFGRSSDEEPLKGLSASFNALKYLSNQKPLETSDQYFNDDNQSSESDSETEIPKSTSTSSTDYNNYDQPSHEVRVKRSSNVKSLSTESPDIAPFYKYATPLAVDLPNFIIGPELSMLPPHQPKTRTKLDDKNFIRLG